jgi:restriction system protein
MDFTQIIKPFAEFSGYLVALAILAATLKSPWFKGVMGEFAVNLAARLFLDKAFTIWSKTSPCRLKTAAPR